VLCYTHSYTRANTNTWLHAFSYNTLNNTQNCCGKHTLTLHW